MYKVGVLGNCCTHGVGALSSLNAREDIKIIAGYELNPRRANELSNALGFALAKSYEEICENSDVDIVVITTDPCDKAKMVEKACKAGKHIFLNKPFCHTLADANRIVKAVEESGAKLVFDISMVKSLPPLSKLKEEILAG